MLLKIRLTIPQSDPYQTVNLAADNKGSDTHQFAGRPLAQVFSRLNALIMVLKTCKGWACTHPYESLHPKGDVSSLKEALNRKYDVFYSTQPQMWYTECPMAYIAEFENQEQVAEFRVGGGLLQQGEGFDWGNHWHHFT
jgi:hypothetical protein